MAEAQESIDRRKDIDGKRLKSRTLTHSRRRQQQRAPSLEEENAQLQLMLQQALRREADTLRKLKHMSDLYRSLNRGTCAINTELNATCTDHEEDRFQVNSPQLVVGNGTDHYRQGSPEDKSKQPATTSLAPLPLGLRDIRLEREKPPVSTGLTSSPSEDDHNPVNGVQVNSTQADLIAQRSISDDHLNRKPLSETLSNPLPDQKSTNPIRSRTASFWKRKQRPLKDAEFDVLFRQFFLRSRIQTDPLSKYLKCGWQEVVMGGGGGGGGGGEVGEKQAKYREVVWELFQEEVKYLTRQLQPLEMVYKRFLEELQFHGFLLDASVDRIFANISELCELSSTVARDLLKLFERRSSDMVAQPNELVLSFSMFGHKFNPVYMRFCTNYELQRAYVKSLEQSPAFNEYHKICRTAPLVDKSSIFDLLIAPMQHLVHYQLILEKVLKYTHNPNHRAVLSSTIKAFVVSLRELESAIAQHKGSVELLELQDMLYWPPVTQLCPDAYVPPSLASRLQSQPCEQLLASASRHQVLRSTFKLLDVKGKATNDVLCVLFNDLLLLAEMKPHMNKKFTVIDQPIPIHQLSVYDDTSSSRPMFTIVTLTALCQHVAMFSFLCPCLYDKNQWIAKMHDLGAALIGQ